MLKLKSLFLILSLLCISLLCVSCGDCSHSEMSEKIVAPSCGEHGYTVFECRNCSYSFESDFVEPTPHELKKETVAPTCKESGYTLYDCKNCDYSHTGDLTERLDHTFVYSTVSATCTSAGYSRYTCSVCGYAYTKDKVEPINHFLSGAIVPPSCEENGYTEYSCTLCDFSYKADYISANTHSFASTVIAPTCLDEGYTRLSCTVCSKEIITDYTSPLGHELTDTVIRPTSSRDGYTKRDCARCDYTYNCNYVYSYGIFKGAYTSNQKVLTKGIDVSTYNGTLNWTKIAATGVDFAIIRAGSSVSGKDAQFEANYSGAKAAGLDVGVYYYVDVDSVEDILKCAEDFEKLIAGKKFEYPVYLDIEKDSLGALGKDLLTEMCTAFIEKLQADGYFAALYTNNNWLENFYHKDVVTALFDIWYARYVTLTDTDPEWNLESYGANMGIWQYTQEGAIDGFDCAFDFNFAYRNYPKLIKENHYNGY